MRTAGRKAVTQIERARETAYEASQRALRMGRGEDYMFWVGRVEAFDLALDYLRKDGLTNQEKRRERLL